MPKTYLFVDEAGRSRLSGSLDRNQPYFIVGVLTTNRPSALLAAVQRARDAFHFTNELHWTKQGSLRNNVYRRVVQEIRTVPDWCYKATCVPVAGFDLSYYKNREDFAYNRMVRLGIDSALKYSQVDVQRELDITIDMKQRLAADNCIPYLQERYSTVEVEEREGTSYVTLRPVDVRELDSKQHDLIQVCDLLSGAKNTILSGAAGPRKTALASEIWLPSHCRVFMATRLGTGQKL